MQKIWDHYWLIHFVTLIQYNTDEVLPYEYSRQGVSENTRTYTNTFKAEANKIAVTIGDPDYKLQ